MDVDSGRKKRRYVRLLQRYLLNPPMKLLAWTGVMPSRVLVETTGRRSGKRRRTVVGMKVDGDIGWVIAEHGRHAGYVANLASAPEVRVRVRGRWRAARAHVDDHDDAVARLENLGLPGNAAGVRLFGSDLTTIRFDFTPSPAGPPEA